MPEIAVNDFSGLQGIGRATDQSIVTLRCLRSYQMIKVIPQLCLARPMPEYQRTSEAALEINFAVVVVRLNFTCKSSSLCVAYGVS